MGGQITGGGQSYQATGYQMIKSLEIARFRCFERARIGDCRRINVIVGKNSSGKTSLLEALFLVAGPSPEIIFRLRGWRGFEQGSVSGPSKTIDQVLWGDIFFNFDTSHNIVIDSVGDEDNTRRLTVTYSGGEHYVPFKSRDKVRDSSGRTPINFRWNIKGRGAISVTPRLEESGIKFPALLDVPTETFLFASNQTYSAMENATRLSQLSKESRDAEVIDKFRSHFPQVEDLSVELYARQPMVYAKLKNVKERIPLNLVSGGMNKLAALLLSFPTAPKCVVLIDEIENGLYYRQLPEIWATLLSFCKRFDAQIFASTHSLECLNAAAQVAENNPSDFSVIQAGKGDLRQFGGDQFVDAINHEVEIR